MSKKPAPIDNAVTLLQKRWPSYSDFAADAGVEYVTAQLWRYRGSIPPDYWPSIVRGADARQIEGVTMESMFALRGVAA